jgi:hypothetical protein
MHKPSGLTIFSIATSKYLDYWVNLIDSYFSTDSVDPSAKWLLLTDRPNEIPERISSALGENLSVRPILHTEWPYPTLMRYQYILDSMQDISTDNFVYLDADMLIASADFISSIMSLLNDNPLVLVRHPGFYRQTGIDRLQFYALNPKYAIRDLNLSIRYGSIGTWETNKDSTAYVPRAFRKYYVCGGIWFGKSDAIFRLCSQLSKSINRDLDKGIIAKYHDESHLNHFNAFNRVKLMPPALCFEPTYPQLKKLSPIVIAVDKKVSQDDA